VVSDLLTVISAPVSYQSGPPHRAPAANRRQAHLASLTEVITQMSNEQDAASPGWADLQGTRPPTPGATAVVPGQRAEAEPAAVPPPPGGAESGQPVEAQPPVPPAEVPVLPPAAPEAATTPHPTTPVGAGGRPRPRPPRRDPMTRMGPWAPVAGAVVGLLLGVVVVLFLAPAVDTFDQRLSLVFVVLGLTLLGAGGTLLADEVRLLRRGAQAAEVRAANVGVIAGLLNGLTPARLLITASAFVLLLSAYVTNGS
jgi:hypothetical protein